MGKIIMYVLLIIGVQIMEIFIQWVPLRLLINLVIFPLIIYAFARAVLIPKKISLFLTAACFVFLLVWPFTIYHLPWREQLVGVLNVNQRTDDAIYSVTKKQVLFPPYCYSRIGDDIMTICNSLMTVTLDIYHLHLDENAQPKKIYSFSLTRIVPEQYGNGPMATIPKPVFFNIYGGGWSNEGKLYMQYGPETIDSIIHTTHVLAIDPALDTVTEKEPENFVDHQGNLMLGSIILNGMDENYNKCVNVMAWVKLDQEGNLIRNPDVVSDKSEKCKQLPN